MKFCYLLALGSILFGTNDSRAQLTGEDSITYVNEILNYRKELDKKLKKEDKPLLPEDRKKFKGLDYFSVKLVFRTIASFERTEAADTIEMKTNKDGQRKYSRYGILSFMIDSVVHKLLTYQNVKQASQDWYDGELFIPFMDKTSGQETNDHGRVLEFSVAESEEDEIILDFNKAFNPYCSYNPRYSCPLPPEENHLKIEIMAGESTYRYGR